MKDSAEQNKLELLNKQGMTRDQMEALLAELYIDYNQDNSNLTTVKNIAGVLEKMEEFEQALVYYNSGVYPEPMPTWPCSARSKLLTDKVQDLKIVALERDVEASPDAPDVEQRRADLAEIKRQRGMKAVGRGQAARGAQSDRQGLSLRPGPGLLQRRHVWRGHPRASAGPPEPEPAHQGPPDAWQVLREKNMNDLAVNAFSDAVKDIAVMDNTKKELLYDLAMVYDKTG